MWLRKRCHSCPDSKARSGGAPVDTRRTAGRLSSLTMMETIMASINTIIPKLTASNGEAMAVVDDDGQDDGEGDPDSDG